jgi:hypothetical protein
MIALNTTTEANPDAAAGAGAGAGASASAAGAGATLAGMKTMAMPMPMTRLEAPLSPSQPKNNHSLKLQSYQYTDYSTQIDPDPLSPLTAPGRVPNFPAKLHAILSRLELEGIVTWLPHGRAWTILRPREFEMQVIPQYFGHTKLSSFIRQVSKS